MLKLNSTILAHLTVGGTLLVPSRQRASAVRLAFTAAMLERGLQVWDSPDVLPWTAWLERELDAARERGSSAPRRLTAMEEWLLWQEAVHEASAGFQILMPDGLIEPVRRAIGLMDDFGLSLKDAPTAEAAALKQARIHFARRCDQLKVLGRASWREVVPFIESRANLMLAGFGLIGPERQRWLEERGARLVSGPSASIGSSRTFACDSARQEAQTAAAWCAACLRRDSRARLLVIVPQLKEQRHLWERAFTQRLNPSAVLVGCGTSEESNFAIEGGRPLADYRLVRTALDLLALSAGRGRFEQLSQVLRSPYGSVRAADAWFALERWLRDHNVGNVSLPSLMAMQPRIGKDLGEAAATALQTLIDALRSDSHAGASSPDAWAQAWVAQLQRFGWPGEALSSDEQQVKMRFDELLGDFAAVVVPSRRLARSEAHLRLQSMARRVAFEPASDDVPVTLTSRLEDPVVGYDGIWVAGLSADVWPPPARPDPLLPLAWQRAAGIPEASAEGQTLRATQLMQRWQSTTAQCIFSFSRNDGDLRRDQSPLLLDVVPAGEAGAGADESVTAWLEAHAPAAEVWTEETRPVQPVSGFLEGGTRLLELQSLCPFRAFAELRLKATPLETPQPGVHPRLRGIILHKALEYFWLRASHQSGLTAMSVAEREQVASQSAADAIEKVMSAEAVRLGERLLARERSRTERLIGQLIEWELRRPAFITRILEEPLQFRLPDAALKVQRDRVDQLADGRLVIIDYKTGAPKKFDALADRLSQPQLPAYAVATGDLSAAVVTLYVGRDGVKASGLQDQPGRIPRLATPKQGEPVWSQRMLIWQQQLELLIKEYLQGDASLRPQPDACKFCHLHSLCRIDPATLAALDTDPDAIDDSDPESESDEDAE